MDQDAVPAATTALRALRVMDSSKDDHATHGLTGAFSWKPFKPHRSQMVAPFSALWTSAKSRSHCEQCPSYTGSPERTALKIRASASRRIVTSWGGDRSTITTPDSFREAVAFAHCVELRDYGGGYVDVVVRGEQV